ncbi:MAG: divergent polysaccharide deacetylase family protein [Acidobacteriota bacterium]
MVTLCVALFALGIGLGIQFAKPPPPPDFSRPALEPPVDDAVSPEVPAGSVEDDTSAPLPEDPMAASADDPQASEDAATALDTVRQPAPGGAPRIAIIIDDLGRSIGQVDELASLGVPLTFSVLPFEVRTAEVVERLRLLDVEYLCHLPMEALGGVDAGPGSLRASMSPDDLRAATLRALEAVPGAQGANNHMGSAVVGDAEAMRTILRVLDERGIFFVDSRTSAQTVGYTVARSLGLASAERQVFLDNDRDPERIRAQFRELLDVAQRRGGAVAIAHPYPETIATLREELPAARAAGVELVPVSRLLER